MLYVKHVAAMSLFCLLCGEGALAQSASCGSEICAGNVASALVDRAPATTTPDQYERCPGLQIEVKASSANERRLTCLAGADTLRLLGRCNIVPKRPLRVEIMTEVRRPFSGPDFRDVRYCARAGAGD